MPFEPADLRWVRRGRIPPGIMACMLVASVFAITDVRTAAPRFRGRGIIDGLDPDVFATASEMIAVSFDASPYLERKFSAMAAHRSVFGVTPEMLKNPPPDAAQMLQALLPVLEREVFLLGGARGPVRRWPLRDFFDGLETAELHAMVNRSPTSEAPLVQIQSALGASDVYPSRAPDRRSRMGISNE